VGLFVQPFALLHLEVFVVPANIKSSVGYKMSQYAHYLEGQTFCLALNAASVSSCSPLSFLGAFNGFFLPPSRPDILSCNFCKKKNVSTLIVVYFWFSHEVMRQKLQIS
jgi:hypothetical protein